MMGQAWATVAVAALLGFALARANSCTVASTRRLVVDRRADWFIGLLIAISWSGLILVGLHTWDPRRFALPSEIELGAPLLGGSVILGIGSVFNRGCFLGSVVQLSRGNLNYVFTLIGIAGALWTASARGPSRIGLHSTELVIAGGGWKLGVVLLFAGMCAYAVVWYRRRRRQTVLALIAVGVSGGVIYALNPDWSYSAVLDHAVHGDFSYAFSSTGAAAIALFAGGILSSLARNTFQIVGLSVMTSLGCLGGGFLMGFGAKLIPGGNDTLMLWSIPGLSRYGPIAYGIMVATIALLMTLQNLLVSDVVTQKLGRIVKSRAMSSRDAMDSVT